MLTVSLTMDRSVGGEGHKEGMAESERKAKMEPAKTMRDEGVDVSVVSKVTGLSADDVLKL